MTRHRKGYIRIVIVALVAGFVGCAGLGGTSAHTAAPDFALKDASGKAIHLSDFAGKVVFVDFWASWCDACRSSIPQYQSLFKRYGSGGFMIIGVSEDDSPEDAYRFASAHQVTYPIVADTKHTTLVAYRAEGLPTAVLVDRTGKIQHQWTAYNDSISRQIDEAIRNAMNVHPQ
jgi:cytochrome c biogenesis protein CcmG/thiol:disulfide interchange protein DsbE